MAENDDVWGGLVSLAEVLDGLIEPMQAVLRSQTSVQTARWVLYVCEGDAQLGQDPGGFASDLIRLMMRADDLNLVRFSQSWPDLTFAVSQWRFEGDALEWLRSVVTGYEQAHAAAFGLPEPEQAP